MTGVLHLVTGEFPPDTGGVSDYSASVARELAARGVTVHVWCTSRGEPSSVAGVRVHRVAGWSAPHFEFLDREMDDADPHAPLLVQWVPHAYGRRSLNIAFCRWVRRRGRRGQPVDLMVHEPFLAFREGSLRQDAAAVVHRLMVSMLLSVARRVWVSIPAWAAHLRPWTFGRRVPFCWLPVPSSIPVVSDPDAVAALRGRLGLADRLVIGHFGTYDGNARQLLRRLVPAVLQAVPGAAVLLIGRDSETYLEKNRPDLDPDEPSSNGRIMATGVQPPQSVSLHLQICDLMLQPYIDGASTRRSTLMAALAHGRPVVTTFGRLSEPLWQECGAVHTVPVDTAALIEATALLAGDAPRRQWLGEAGRSLYESRFALEHMIRALCSNDCIAA